MGRPFEPPVPIRPSALWFFSRLEVTDALPSSLLPLLPSLASPCLAHSSVAASCGSPTVNDGYSYGVLIMFDWNLGSESSPSLVNTAHFGGKPNIETLWASRGVRLLAR